MLKSLITLLVKSSFSNWKVPESVEVPLVLIKENTISDVLVKVNAFLIPPVKKE